MVLKALQKTDEEEGKTSKKSGKKSAKVSNISLGDFHTSTILGYVG